MHNRTDESTSNLKCHTDECDPDMTSTAIAMYASGCTYSKARMHHLLVKWISCHHHPFAVVEDVELIEIFQMLYVHVFVPLRQTVSRNAHPGKLHISVDGWTSPNVYAFLGITIHLVYRAKMMHLFLNFIK
ncbi:hypothetical protein K439DRAFT_1339216 [Ramaria rubella]|nr:hypothetical protein K439DRAFT_1339216 [Ramaria rubella]